jgi:hypothetical protein
VRITRARSATALCRRRVGELGVACTKRLVIALRHGHAHAYPDRSWANSMVHRHMSQWEIPCSAARHGGFGRDLQTDIASQVDLRRILLKPRSSPQSSRSRLTSQSRLDIHMASRVDTFCAVSHCRSRMAERPTRSGGAAGRDDGRRGLGLCAGARGWIFHVMQVWIVFAYVVRV